MFYKCIFHINNIYPFRYAKTITKGYLISMCNALLFFFSLPIIEILITKHEDSDNFTMNFPFAASYPMAFYKFPLYEVPLHFTRITNMI